MYPFDENLFISMPREIMLAPGLQEFFYCSNFRVLQGNSAMVFKNSILSLSACLLFHSDTISEKWFLLPNKILEEKRKVSKSLFGQYS